MPDSTLITTQTAAAVEVQTADGFVVVSEWTRARFTRPSYSYDHCRTLDDARREYVAYQRGEHDGFKAIGIFPSVNGLPIAGALDLSLIDRVTPPYDWAVFHRTNPDSPENTALRQRARFNGQWNDGDEALLAKRRAEWALLNERFYQREKA